MHKLLKLILAMLFLAGLSAVAFADYLRLSNGGMLGEGDTKMDVFYAIGEPIFKDKESSGINDGESEGLDIESWYYDYRGEKVMITFEGGVIKSINRKQKGRM